MNLREVFRPARVIPVAVFDDVGPAVTVAELLARFSFPVIEVTLRTAGSLECIAAIRDRVPDLIVGCGSVLSASDLDAAVSAGARFGFAPCLDEKVVEHAAGRGVPFIPGVATPSELNHALQLGCAVVKVFPAAPGGPSFVRGLCAPFGRLAPKVIPTGGVTESALAGYLALPEVVAVGATYLVERDLVARGDLTELERRMERTRRVIDELGCAPSGEAGQCPASPDGA